MVQIASAFQNCMIRQKDSAMPVCQKTATNVTIMQPLEARKEAALSIVRMVNNTVERIEKLLTVGLEESETNKSENSFS